MVIWSHWVLLALWIFWVATYWIMPYIFKIHGSNTHLSKSFQDILTLALLGLSLGTILFSITAMTIFDLYPAYQFRPWVSGVGLVLVSLGLGGMFWGRSRMGPLWLPETGLKDKHWVVDSGLYGIVRHPIYSFALVFCLGSVLVSPVWWHCLALLGALIGYIRKVLEEEAFLVDHLPGYIDYQRRVCYRLVPGIW